MEQKINKNVIGMWDALKGGLVLVVILGHTFATAAEICQVSEWPILFRLISKSQGVVIFTFFIISGYLFKPKKNGIGKQYFSYLRIYLIASVGIVFAQIIHNYFSGTAWNEQLGRLILGLFYGATSHSVLNGVRLISPVAMWFFLVFMNGSLILQWIMRLKKEKIRNMVIFGGVIIFFLWYGLTGQWGEYPFTDAPLFPIQTGVAVVLMYIGYLLKENKVLFRPFKLCFYLTAALFSLAIFYYGDIDMVNNQYRLGILDWAGGICGAVTLIAAYIRICNPDWKIIEWLMWLGRRSMWIIPVHSVETMLIRWDERQSLAAAGVWPAAIIIFILRCTIIVFICKSIEKLQRKIQIKKRK